jgi:NAD(P)-dependent dehydrogenase (short-subunit alcohol dehydrogenase family)
VESGPRSPACWLITARRRSAPASVIWRRWPIEDVTPLQRDVTNPAEITAANVAANDVTIVINSAAVDSEGTKLLDGSSADARLAMEVNYFGTWAISRAFDPVLARNGGGALVNMLSVASLIGPGRHLGRSPGRRAQLASPGSEPHTFAW